MSADNQEFPIPFEESRRGSNSNPEEKAALGRLGRYLGSRATNRPTIGDRRNRGRNSGDFSLPTGGKPGTRNPTGSRRDVDGDGWADEGTTKPVWVGVDAQGKKPGSASRRSGQRNQTSKLSSGADYMGQHQAPDRDNGAPLHELTANGIYPDDIYSNDALEMYGFGGDFSAEALSIANSAKGKPNKQIKIYRAVPLSTEDEIRGLEKQAAQIMRRGRIPNSVTTPLDVSEYYDFVLSEIERLKSLTPEEKIKINSGDWVTPIREYAASHGRSHLNNKYKIVSKTVPAKHLFTDGNSIEEWGYDSGVTKKRKGSQDRVFSPRGEELGDQSESLSSGKTYQEIVDAQPELSEDKKQSISNFIDEIESAEFKKEDIRIPDTRPKPPRPPGMPEPKPTTILQDSEDRTLQKRRAHSLLAEAFEGEMTLDNDIIIKSDTGEGLNIGKTVLIEILPPSEYLPAVTAKKVSDTDIAEQEELQLYDKTLDIGDLLTEVDINFRIKPLPEYNEKLVELLSKDNLSKTRYISREDGTPSIGKASRTLMQVSADGKEIRMMSHDSFYVSELAQGQGIGSFFNARNEKIYEELGVRSVFTWGVSDNAGSRGAVHWPKNGFSWGGETEKQKFIKVIDDALTNNPELFSEQDRARMSSLYTRNRDTGLFETDATAEELLDFPAANEVFSNATAQFMYVRPLRELVGASSGRDSSSSLSSGKAPRYPRTPTLGAFLGKADEDFADVDSWEEFKRLYDDKEVVFFDYETTGLVFGEFGEELAKGAPVQFGAVKIKNGKEVGRINLFMNPEEELGEWSRKNLKDVDGNPLTDDWLRQQMSVADAHRQLVEFAGPDALFGVQNAAFDKGVLDDVLEQMGEEWRPSGYLDTREIAALTLPKWTPENEDGPFATDRDGNRKPSSSLAAITEYLGVDLGDGHHNADVDAFATSQVMQKMIDGAIEKGWSKDALNKEKRDALHRATVDKFDSEVAQFEKEKESFLAAQTDDSESLSSGKNQVITVGPIKKGMRPKKIQVRSEELRKPDGYENYTQYDALDAIYELNEKARPGEPSWRLPTVQELLAIYKKNTKSREKIHVGEYLTEEYDGGDEKGPWVRTVNTHDGRVGRERIYNSLRVLLVSDTLPSKEDSKFSGPPTTRKLNAFIKDTGVSVSKMNQDNEGSVSFTIPLKGQNSDDDAYEFVRKLESWARSRQLSVREENEFPEDMDWSGGLTEEQVRQSRTGINIRVYDSLASGRQRPLIPMRNTQERKPVEPGKRGVKGYGQKDDSGNEVRRSSTKWLAGMTSEEMSIALVPSSKEEHFEMWADDLAVPGWNKDRKYRKFLKEYYDQLNGHENALRIDYSPEGIEASRELVRSMLDSSPQMKWMFENFGAPLVGVFTRDAMNEYEGRPDVKERMELLRQQRGMEKTPFVSGLASREFGFVGLTPRALIDRESYDNAGGKYPLELDPNRKPALREAHIDRSLHGTLIHEYGHWLHYRAIRDLETNISGGSKTYYGSGKLDDPRYRAALDVAEEYANPDTDNEAIEIYSQFIDLTGRDAEEMFKAYPDKALTATSYGNVNKREAIAEAFVAIMHPNKDLAKNVLSPKLRRDIYALSGVDPDNLPWEARSDGRPTIRLSSGAQPKPERENRRNRISRALRQLVGADQNEQEETEEPNVPYEFEAPERPEGLASFAPEPSDSLRSVLPIPNESDMTEELVNDVKQIPIDPILERLSSLQVSGFGVSMFSSEEERKASSAAKRMISLNVSETANIDPREFVESFSDESIAAAGLDPISQKRFFNAARNFKALKEIFDAIDALPADASDEDKAKARRFAVDRTTGSLVPTENHDKIIQKRFYYDEMIDKLEERSYEELFGPEWEDLTRIALNDEKSVVSPYLIWAVGGNDAQREMISFGQQIRGMFGEFIKEIKKETGSKPRDPFTGRELGDDEGLALVFAPIGEIDPRTGKPGMAIVSTTGTATEAMANDMRLLLGGGRLVPENERTDEQHRAYDRLYVKGMKDDYLERLAEAGLVIVDKENVDSDETKELFRNFLINRLRFIAGNAENYKAQYEFTSGVSFFDIDTPEGLREAKASIVSDIIHTWAISANNSNPVAMAIQHEARKMFGLDEAVGWYGRVRGPREGLRLDSAVPVEQRAELGDLAFDDTPELSPKQAEIISSVVKGIYDATQHYYKSKGITHVAIWRGMKGTPEMVVPRGELAERRVSMRPLSSWTTNSNMAQMFSTTLASTKRPGIDAPEEEQAIYDENLLMKAYVPVEQIFSNPLTGFGCLGEDEVVLLGRPTDTIMITPPANFLPEAITDESVSDDVRKVTDDILNFATNRDKVTNAAYRQLTGLGYGDFEKRFDSMSSGALSSGANARRSIPSMAEMKKEISGQYRVEEMSDVDIAKQYLIERIKRAEEVYESRNPNRTSGERFEHFVGFLDFLDNEKLLIRGMSDEEILDILKEGKTRSVIDHYNNAIDNIGKPPKSRGSALSSGAQLSSGKVIKYNFVEARMRASDIKVTFNRDPERVAAVKSTLAKGFMGGFTVEVDRMDDIKEGIAIARNKHGMKVDAVADFDAEGNPSDELVDTFLAWMDFHGPKTFMEPKSGAEKTTIGGWVSDGTVYLDVVDVYPNTEENIAKAADMGMSEDQIAVTNLNKLWELLEKGEDPSPAFIDSGGTGGFTLDEESVKRVSAALSDLNSNKFNTGSMQLKRIGNTKKFTKGPVSGARRVRNTDFATGEKQDYWIVAGTDGVVKVFTHEQYLKVRDRKIQGLFDKMSTQSDILASMFEAKNIKPAASMSFVGGRNVGKPKVAKEHKNRGLTSGMANLYGFSNNLPKVGIQMGDKIVAAMI